MPLTESPVSIREVVSSQFLSGDDEDAIRALFTDEVLTFFEQHEGRSIERASNKRIFHRDAVNVTSVGVRALLHESFLLESLLQPVNRR